VLCWRFTAQALEPRAYATHRTASNVLIAGSVTPRQCPNFDSLPRSGLTCVRWTLAMKALHLDKTTVESSRDIGNFWKPKSGGHCRDHPPVHVAGQPRSEAGQYDIEASEAVSCAVRSIVSNIVASVSPISIRRRRFPGPSYSRASPVSLVGRLGKWNDPSTGECQVRNPVRL